MKAIFFPWGVKIFTWEVQSNVKNIAFFEKTKKNLTISQYWG
jgi:hypothetical protein